MYTKKTEIRNFPMFGVRKVTTFTKDGIDIAKKVFYTNGNTEYIFIDNSDCVKLTRQQAYRYWEKHFKGMSYWALPHMLALLTAPHASYAGAYNGWFSVYDDNDNYMTEGRQPCTAYYNID